MKLSTIIIGCAVLLMATSCKNQPKEEVKAPVAEAPKPVPGTPIKFDSSKRYIYLTWDDSPQPPGTRVCIDLFRKEGIKATFFSVGMHAFDIRRKALVDEIRNSYPQFLLGNHSYSHGFKDKYKSFYNLPDSAVQDFLHNEEELKVPVKIIRLPGCNSWVLDGKMQGQPSTKKVYEKLDALGYSVIGWDLEWRFLHGNVPVQSATEMAKEVNEKFEDALTVAPNAIVILAHDRMFAKPQYADSLSHFIDILKSDPRNVFETIDHYPLIKYAVKDTLNKKK